MTSVLWWPKRGAIRVATCASVRRRASSKSSCGRRRLQTAQPKESQTKTTRLTNISGEHRAEEAGVEPTEDAWRPPTGLKPARVTGPDALPRTDIAGSLRGVKGRN